MTEKSATIRLIRHGVVHTGGAQYEELLAEIISQALATGKKPEIIVLNRRFRGIQNLILISKGYLLSSAGINIVTARLAIPAIISNLFTKNQTIVVLHNYDRNDGKGFLLEAYYRLLFYLLSLKIRRVSVISVSPFFSDYFKTICKNIPVFMIPNLFDTCQYSQKISTVKTENIFLGQYSSKNDPLVFKLADMLTEAGYNCFFCTLYQEEASKKRDYEVIYCGFDQYLGMMAGAKCTIAFTGINEGWNRIVHESILVGTPVIGFEKGGLGNLLRESDSYIVNDENEAFDLIINEKVKFRTAPEFIRKYDISTAGIWIAPLIDFLNIPE